MRRAADFGVHIGQLPSGPSNSMADIDGLRFGEVTLSDGAVQTGITVIHPAPGNMFESKCVASAHVINGFGKSVGLIQLTELGELETPIVLTNTLSVGTASTALVRHMLEANPAIGASTGTVNPLVMECNDGAWLNDIRGLHVTEAHVAEALGQNLSQCPQGATGAGTGMSCYGLKGGIGSASRLCSMSDQTFTLAALTLCNMGQLPDLLVDGRKVGQEIDALEKQERLGKNSGKELGSIIILLATDAPLSSRQLNRLCVRAGAGLARTGTHLGSGSGDVVLAFSTANRKAHDTPSNPVLSRSSLHEGAMDQLFRATVEATEEAILNALFVSKTTQGKEGRHRTGLADWWDRL